MPELAGHNSGGRRRDPQPRRAFWKRRCFTIKERACSLHVRGPRPRPQPKKVGGGSQVVSRVVLSKSLLLWEEDQGCRPCSGSWNPSGLTSEHPVGKGRREARLTPGALERLQEIHNGPGTFRGHGTPWRLGRGSWKVGLESSESPGPFSPLRQGRHIPTHPQEMCVGGCSWGKLSQTSHIERQGQGTAWKSGLCGKFFIPAGERGPPPCLPTPVRLCPLRGSTALTCLRGLGTGPALQKVASGEDPQPLRLSSTTQLAPFPVATKPAKCLPFHSGRPHVP